MLDYNQLEQQYGALASDNTKIPGINPTTDKLNSLAKATESKLAKLTTDTLLGMNDADSLITANAGGNTREALGQNDYGYDAVEIQHTRNGVTSNPLEEATKNRWKQGQIQQVAELKNKPVEEVTEQDFIDVGNMQQIQKLADLARLPGEERWEAPLIEGVEQTNLTGTGYRDENGQLVDGTGEIPLDVAITSKRVGTDIYNRPLYSFGDAAGNNVTEQTQNDPRLNANYTDPTVSQYDAYKAALGNTSESEVNVENIVKNVGSDVGTFAADFVDTIFDLGANLGQKAYENLTGKKVTQEDLDNLEHLGFQVDANGNVDHKWSYEKDGTETAQAFDNLLGIDDTAFNNSQAKFGNKVDEVMLSDMSAWDKTKEVIGIAYDHKADLPQMVSSSLTYVAALGKAPVQMLMAATNSHLEEVKDNNNGKPADFNTVMRTTGITAVELGADYIAGKLTFGVGKGVGAANKKVVDTMFKALPKSGSESIIAKTIGSIVKKGTGVGLAVVEEGSTEALQTTLGLIAERIGTEKYDGKGVWELLDEEARAEIRKAGYSGAFAGAGQNVAGSTVKAPFEMIKALNSTEEVPSVGLDSLPEGTISKTTVDNINAFETGLANSTNMAELKKSVDSGETGDAEYRKKADVVVSSMIGSLEAELEQLNSTDKLTAEQHEAKQILVDKITEYTLLKNRYIDQSATRPVLNSRPITEIQDEIKTVEAEIGDGTDTKLKAKLKTLKIEEMVAKLVPNAPEQTTVAKGKKVTAQDSLGLKFYGGTVGNTHKNGIIEYVQLLADEGLSADVRTNIEARLQYFLGTQEKKLQEMEAAEKKWKELPDVVEYTDSLTGETRYGAKEGTNPVVEYRRSGKTWKYHENSQEQLKQEQDEYRILQAAAQAAIAGTTEGVVVDKLNSKKYSSGTVAPKVTSKKVTEYLAKQFAAGKTADEMISEAKAELGVELAPATQAKIRTRLETKATETAKEVIEKAPVTIDEIVNSDEAATKEYTADEVSEVLEDIVKSPEKYAKYNVADGAEPTQEQRRYQQFIVNNSEFIEDSVPEVSETKEETEAVQETVTEEVTEDSTDNEDVKKAQVELFNMVHNKNGTIKKALAKIATAKEEVNDQVKAINEVIGEDYKPTKKQTTKQKLYEIRERLLGNTPKEPKKTERAPTAEQVDYRDRLAEAEAESEEAKAEVVAEQMKPKKATAEENYANSDDSDRAEMDRVAAIEELTVVYGFDPVTLAQLDNAQEILDSDVDKAEKLLAEAQDEIAKEAKIEGTVGYKLIEASKSIAGKVRDSALFTKLITEPREKILGTFNPNAEKKLSENSNKLKDIGLDKYFKPSANGTNIQAIYDIGKSGVDMTQYRQVFIEVMAGISGLFNGKGNIKLHDTTRLLDVGIGQVEDGFDTISRLLLQQSGEEKLNPELIKEVKHAITVATIDWMYENADGMRAANRSADDVRKLLGIADQNAIVTDEMRAQAAVIDGLVTPEANAIGAKAYKYLQLKAGKSNYLVNTEMIEAKLKTELGLIGLAALDNAGTIRLMYKEKGSKDGRGALAAQDVFGTDGKDVKGFVFIDSEGIRLSAPMDKVQVNGRVVDKGLRDSIDIVRETVDKPVEKHGVFKTAKEAIPRLAEIVNEGVTGIVSEVSGLHKKAIVKQSATANKFVKSYFDVIDAVTGIDSDTWAELDNEAKDEHALELARYLGYVDENTVHVSRRAGVIGKNNAILLDIKHLMEARAEYGDSEMFARWKVITNNRFMIDSNKLNWQDKKLHRHAVDTSKIVVNEKTEEVFKMALAQSFGIKVDKLTRKTAVEKKYAEVEEKLVGMFTDENGGIGGAEGIQKAMDYLILEKGNEPTHAMMGLGEFIEYSKWMLDGKNGEFKSGLRLETDDTTSGYILKLLQMPIFSKEDGTINIDKLYEELARGGVTDKSRYGYKSFGERVELAKAGKIDAKDSYEQPAEVLKNKLDQMELSDSDSRGLASAISLLGGKVNMSDGTIEEITRIIMKHPFMTLNYGSAINTIIDNLTKSVMYGNTVTGAKGIGGVMEEIYAAIESGKESLIDDKVELLNGLVELLYTNKDGQVNQGKVDAKMKELNAAISSKSVLNYEMFTINEAKSIEFAIKKLLKDPITDTFQSSYGELIEATGTINEAMTAQFRLGKITLDKMIDAELKRRLKIVQEKEWKDGVPKGKESKRVAPLTSKDINKLVQKLAKVFPVFDTALEVAGSKEKAKVFIAGQEKTSADDYANTNMSSWATVRESNGKKTLGAASEVYKLIEKYSSGAVIPIHFLDASRQATILAKLKALGVHDAFYGDIATIEELTEEANKAVYEIARGYSLTTEMLKSIVDTISIVDKSIIEEYTVNEIMAGLEKAKELDGVFESDSEMEAFALNAAKYGADAVGSLGLDEDTEKVVMRIVLSSQLGNKLEGLVKLQHKAEMGRVELFSNENIRMEHAYMEGADYKPGKVGKYKAQVVPGVQKALAKVGRQMPANIKSEDGTIAQVEKATTGVVKELATKQDNSGTMPDASCKK